MLASYIAPAITGRYDFTAVPVALPTPLVRALLPTADDEWGFLAPDDARTASLGIPDAGPGKSWIVLEAGKQIHTGMSYVPFGRSTFFEAKVEVPFLRHPATQSAVPITHKSSMLFSSRLMSFSAAHLTGLRSHRVVCVEDDAQGSFEAMDWLKVVEDGEVQVPDEDKWDEALLRQVLTGYWVGENTGDAATKFIMSSLSPARPRPQLRIRLNLAAVTELPVEVLQRLAAGTDLTVEENGWIEVSGAGYALSESTHLEVTSLSSL
ncbi:hypothetical protein Rhopal_004590-T1 [Rhodotorula paludigena]|uniref:Uncharacterized protein n=1 Tax=Rhodotorula paludigena TaxID=86838 RepID=A0AAV5GRA0_9BASI|nr:hypothetical protein Rhopal_004590-T1 [Rhodotorula paludigena]